jgi:hypothetical protein
MVQGVTELSGLRNIRTMNSSNKRSIPRVRSSAYLELYMLRKEKNRLEKEVNILEKRKKSNQKRIDEIIAEMEKLEKEEAMGRQASSGGIKKPSEKKWKTMSLKY